MIKLDELKPILESLLTDENSAGVIESITAIDTHQGTDETIVERLAEAENKIVELDKEWNKKYKETFLGTRPLDETMANQVDEVEETEETMITTFEELFETE